MLSYIKSQTHPQVYHSRFLRPCHLHFVGVPIVIGRQRSLPGAQEPPAAAYFTAVAGVIRIYLFFFLIERLCLAVVFASFMGFTLSLVKGGLSSNEDKRENVFDNHKSKEAWDIVNVSMHVIFYMFFCLLCKN